MVSPSLILMERFGMLVSGVIQSHSCGEVWYVSKWCHPVSFLLLVFKSELKKNKFIQTTVNSHPKPLHKNETG
jgi:hypothetical protein